PARPRSTTEPPVTEIGRWAVAGGSVDSRASGHRGHRSDDATRPARLTPPLVRFNGRMDGSNLRQSARASTSFLNSTVDLNWDQPIPEMTWSVREVVAHISEVLLWYSTDL